MLNILFQSQEHEDFYLDMLSKSKREDCYHQAFFYLMGITAETRTHIHSLFDFEGDFIDPDGMQGGWQTGSTIKLCQLAFNLWNGYEEDNGGGSYSPDALFCCEFAPYFVEALKLRYPEYFREASAMPPLCKIC